MKLKKFLYGVALGALALTLTSCYNSEQEFPDFEGGTTAYFAYQYPVRTLVLGNDIYDNTLDNAHKFQIWSTMGGAYNGRDAVVDIVVDETLCDNLWFTAEGVAVLEPYAEPSAENIQHTLDGDNVRSLLLPRIRRQTDIYSAANVFKCVCATPDKSAILTATAVNNSPSSPFSVIRRGRRIVKTVQVRNIASQADLQAYADRLRNESMLRGETIQVETALLPGFGVADVVALHYGDLSALCLDHSWSMDFQPGGTMTHTLERVVYNLG